MAWMKRRCWARLSIARRSARNNCCRDGRWQASRAGWRRKLVSVPNISSADWIALKGKHEATTMRRVQVRRVRKAMSYELFVRCNSFSLRVHSQDQFCEGDEFDDGGFPLPVPLPVPFPFG